MVSLRQKHKYLGSRQKKLQKKTLNLILCLILVGKALSPEKSASWAPWEKSRSKCVRFGHLWANSLRTSTVMGSHGNLGHISCLVCSLPVPHKQNKKVYGRNVNPRNFWSKRNKTPKFWILAECLPFLTNPGANGDKDLVRDVAKNMKEDLIRKLLHMSHIGVLKAHCFVWIWNLIFMLRSLEWFMGTNRLIFWRV